MDEFRSELTANLDFRTGLRAGFRADPFRFEVGRLETAERVAYGVTLRNQNLCLALDTAETIPAECCLSPSADRRAGIRHEAAQPAHVPKPLPPACGSRSEPRRF